MSEPLTTDNYQIIYCAVCLEVTQELSAKGRVPEMAITIVRGTAVCEEHRRRVDGFDQAVFGAKRFLTRDDRQASYGPRGRT
jgi:L-asparaginase/Glu-tRNA(Gln) amidotransferase subunit D